MKRPPVGMDPRPLVVSAEANWSMLGHWLVNVVTMSRNEAQARGLDPRHRGAFVDCRSEAQARKLAELLSEETCDDGPEPAEEDDES